MLHEVVRPGDPLDPPAAEEPLPATGPGDDDRATVRLQVLGPLRVWHGRREVGPGPRQQAYLFALLLALHGDPVPTGVLVQLVWGDDPPASALNVLHKYIGALRRLLEPDLPVGARSSLLARRGASYACTPGPGMLDLADFRLERDRARTLAREGRRAEAVTSATTALRRWKGPTGSGFAHTPEAMALFAGLDAEFLGAAIEATDLAVAAGQPDVVLPSLLHATSMAPLHEPVQAALVRALGAAGRQAEALSAFARVRTRLADELGIDPGPLLEAAHRDVLRPAVGGDTIAGTGRRSSDGQARASVGGDVVGRAEESAAVRSAVDLGANGASGLLVVEGEPGAGKTNLLDHAAAQAMASGSLVARGRCTDSTGAPALWPWTQVVLRLLDSIDPPRRDLLLDGPIGRLVEPPDEVVAGSFLTEASHEFRLFEQVCDLVREASSTTPLLILLDDLQWADDATLDLLCHVMTDLPPGVVLMVALRDRAPVHGPGQARLLAAASRVPGHRRIQLGPLTAAAVEELVRRETGVPVTPETGRTIHDRSAGNPFFVLELARLLGQRRPEGPDDLAQGAVPSSVRDVVRHRIADLAETSRGVLEAAAVIGPEVGVGLLSHVDGATPSECLARIEPLRQLGLIRTGADQPSSVHFVHDIVRESVVETMPTSRRAELHLRVADALEAVGATAASAPEVIAYHLWSAGPLADPARTASALVRSSRRAAGAGALAEAEQLLRRAARVASGGVLDELELEAILELTAVIGMRAMYVGVEHELLERAERLARSLGREAEATEILFSRWVPHAHQIELDRGRPLAQRLLHHAESSQDPVVRALGTQAWGVQQWSEGNIGEAHRYLSSIEDLLLAGSDAEGAISRDLRILGIGIMAETSALHDEVPRAHRLLEQIRLAGDDPYALTVWAAESTRVAIMIDDPELALHAAEIGIATDPELSYAFLGTCQRLSRDWAHAVTGVEPAAAAASAQAMIRSYLERPVRTCVSTWHGMLAEMWIAAGDLGRAEVALDRADYYLRRYEQRYAAALVTLQRAGLQRAQGAKVATVRGTVLRARAVAERQEAHLFVRRADAVLETL